MTKNFKSFEEFRDYIFFSEEGQRAWIEEEKSFKSKNNLVCRSGYRPIDPTPSVSDRKMMFVLSEYHKWISSQGK